MEGPSRLIALILAIAVLAAPGIAAAAPETALAEYVHKPDASFAWEVRSRFAHRGTEIAELRLHSQTWRGFLWKHRMHVLKPRRLDADTSQAVLIVAGGRWHDSYDTETAQAPPEDAALFLGIAERLRSLVVVLEQVPFQPLFNLREDDLIAYTFDQYLESGDEEWPLLLPMVKSAVKAMDAAQAFSREEWGIEVEAFTVLGGSKRGWTTWLTGAIEPRATALVPIVINVLNFEEHFEHQIAMWGAPSVEIRPYTERNLHHTLATDQGAALRTIVDPYSYRSRLTQPKLIVIGTNDAYFPVNALNLYWSGLSGPKHVLYLPNDEHSIEDFARLIPTVAAFHRHAAAGNPMPRLEWEFSDGQSQLALCVRADTRPRTVRAWVAYSEDLDFRDATWSPQSMQKDAQSGYRFELAHPSSGYAAVFGEAVFGRGRSAYYLSTSPSIIGSSDAKVAGAAANSATRICS